MIVTLFKTCTSKRKWHILSSETLFQDRILIWFCIREKKEKKKKHTLIANYRELPHRWSAVKSVNLPPPAFPGTGTGWKQWPAGFSGSLSPETSSGTTCLSAQPPSSAAPAVPAVMLPPEIKWWHEANRLYQPGFSFSSRFTTCLCRGRMSRMFASPKWHNTLMRKRESDWITTSVHNVEEMKFHFPAWHFQVLAILTCLN